MIRTLAEHWWVLLLRGLVAILFGFVAYAQPGAAIAVLVLLWGAYALIDGIFEVIAGVRAKYGSLILLGLLGIAAGIVTFLWPGITAVTLLYIIAFSGRRRRPADRGGVAPAQGDRGRMALDSVGGLHGPPRRDAHASPRGRGGLGDVADRIVRDGVGRAARDPGVPAEGAPGGAEDEDRLTRLVS